MTLDELGPRLCIMGPSNSGKSTLADAIAHARRLPPVHLDQLRHLPGTDWKMRPDAEFAALHDRALAAERWVMEGNYFWLLPQRLARATGFILLDAPAPLSLFRYLRRCWFERDRIGGLQGGRDSAKWDMVGLILGATRADRRRCAELFATINRPKVYVSSPAALADFYRANGLDRRRGRQHRR